MRPADEFVAALNPALSFADAQVSWWIRQVTLRLRREVGWCWQQRTGGAPHDGGQLPPLADPAQDSLDLLRFDHDKRDFFECDVTARYLTEQLDAFPAPADSIGPWSHAVRAAGLSDAAQFLLALALAARVDAALGPVCAAIQSDPGRPFPTLALAQRLWDDPLAPALIAHAGHPLFAYGLLATPGGARETVDWHQPLEMPAAVACTLLQRRLPAGLLDLPAAGGAPFDPGSDAEFAIAWLNARPPVRMQIVPLLGAAGSDFAKLAGSCALRTGRPVALIADEVSPDRAALLPMAAAAWLLGVDLLVPEHWNPTSAHERPEPWHAAVQALPLRWYLPVADRGVLHAMEAHLLAPALPVPQMGYRERLDALRDGLGLAGVDLEPELAEVARRFRFQHRSIRDVTQTLQATGPEISAEQLLAACRSSVSGHLGDLAQRVEPRFGLDELVLPPVEARQLQEIVRAMRALTRVHYQWGAARAWNEGGLSVLFAGGPGTGKTMAAEAISTALSLPMYRVDLAQVVNKYIGETEKNLRRIFDAAEASDVLLFFDEADALFGKRTEVKDAHDRFANIEVSYLLERMERFKGLAVLATNRRKDLDEAFTRRLRYIVEFPMPGEAERREIWRRSFPPGADVADLDLGFLAEQFELPGGHIRSVALNACLQCAGELLEGERRQDRRLSMQDALTALVRELQKMGRPTHSGLFGRYASLVEEGLK